VQLICEDQIGATAIRTHDVGDGHYNVTITTVGEPSRTSLFGTKSTALVAHGRAVQQARSELHTLKGQECPSCSD
jgi:hypothetical protein